jgi:ABC-type uncharacterized transport system involved in gliding motility auxiliary subunit
MQYLSKLDRKTLTIASLVLAGLFLFFVNILASGEIHQSQVDLTQNRLFTLADGSRKIIATIDEPVLFEARARAPRALCRDRRRQDRP